MMQISAKTAYACIAMLDLAMSHLEPDPVQLRRIAAAHRIPARFLVQILLRLKSAGLILTTRGAAGGYRLARDPQQITVWDVVRTMEGPQVSIGVPAHGLAAETMRDLWQEASESSRSVLESVSFAQLVERTRRHAHDMYYI